VCVCVCVCNATFGHFPPSPSPLRAFFFSLSPPLRLFRDALCFLVAFAFPLPAWSVISFRPKFCVYVFSGLKFCSALLSYSTRPTLPGYMVPILVTCGPFDLISRRLLFVFPPVLTAFRSFILATFFLLRLIFYVIIIQIL
jgi:hypothetical protein